MSTVRDVRNTGRNTMPLMGLQRQIVAAIDVAHPGVLVPITDLPCRFGPTCFPFMQHRVKASFNDVIGGAARGPSLITCYRMTPGQICLASWADRGINGIPLAAAPGKSNHQKAAAGDVSDWEVWQHRFMSHGWRHLAPSDPTHFDRMGLADFDLIHAETVAIQRLYNAHNAKKLAVDGILGPATLAAVLTMPSAGYPGVAGVELPMVVGADAYEEVPEGDLLALPVGGWGP